MAEGDSTTMTTEESTNSADVPPATSETQVDDTAATTTDAAATLSPDGEENKNGTLISTDSSTDLAGVTTPSKANLDGTTSDVQLQVQDTSQTSNTNMTTTTTTINNTRPALPSRNPSSDSLRSGPLPTIEECLYGIPKEKRPSLLRKGKKNANNNTEKESNKTETSTESTSGDGDDNNIINNDNDDNDELQYFVPLNLLRRVSSQGIDDDNGQAGHRALAWRLLLGFLPADRRQWQTVAQQQRQSYHTFVQELFCLQERDINGSELRGHHSKRHSSSKQDSKLSKKERREERRRKRQQAAAQNDMDNENTSQRLPIKFLDDLPPSHSMDSIADDSVATTNTSDNDNDDDDINASNNSKTSHDDANAAGPPDLADEDEAPTTDDTNSEAEMKLSSSDLLHDDPSLWNMSVREQKILERLTNHDAVNQLLVKRDCKEWNNFLENATLLDEIRKDVNRTHPHLYFYLEPHQQLGPRRYGALERILFVWAKLNKGVRYVQGMNEIVGTLYYVLANDFNDEWADHAEADTYILFNIIMSEMRDIFVADLDTSDTGIVGRIENMQNLLHLHDPQVKGHLDDMGIDASFYAVRWLTTLLSREFLLPDTIRLWDSMFASTHKENFLRYVCVTMVLNIREDLLKADFATSLQLLQKYPSSSMDDLLDASRALWIYESQITMACLKGGLTLHQALQAVPPPDKVIMAFGLRGGIALTNREQLEKAGAHAKQAVRNNVDRARQAGQGILGGARRFIQGRIQRAAENNNIPDGGDSSETVPRPRQRIPFRNFSFGGRAASTGDADNANRGEHADNHDVGPSNSDAETV